MKQKNFRELLLLLIAPALTLLPSAIIDSVYNISTGYFLYLACVWFLYSIFNKLSLSYAIAAILSAIISFINYCKLSINGTPLFLNDFAMADNLNEIAGFAMSQVKITPALIIALIVLIVSIFLLLFGERHIKKTRRMRIISLITSIFLLAFFLIPYGSANVSKLLKISKLSSEELTADFGTLTGLYLAYAQDNEFESNRNTDLLKKRIKGLEYDTTNTDTLPNVIFVMSESFFDIDRLENLSFSKDPIPNFHAIRDNYSSGRFVSSTYCGGTGFVEMEVLTGLCSYHLKNSDDLTTLPTEKYSSMPALSEVFLNNGYQLTFLHSYNSKLYNREEIYKALGFQNILFEDSFPKNCERSGGYISDKALADKIINLYENKGDEPMMLYAVSMENHQPYNKNKYDEKSEIEIKSDLLTNEEKGILNTFVHGLNNADKSLGRLVEYFKNVNEPTVLVFWGDHLPNLNRPNGSVYETLGYSIGGNTASWKSEDLLKMLSTDYIIWDNMGLSKNDKMIGSSMFGLEIANRINLRLNNYFNWINSDIKDNYIMYRPRLFVPHENEVYSYVPEKYEDIVDNYSLAVYDIIYGKNELF